VRGPLCPNPQIYKCGLARLDLNIARIERAEVLLRQYRASVFRRLEIEVDEFVHGATVQEAQDFTQDKRRGCGADERRADGLAGEQRDAAAIERAACEHTFVCRAVLDLVVGLRAAPDLRRRPRGR